MRQGGTTFIKRWLSLVMVMAFGAVFVGLASPVAGAAGSGLTEPGGNAGGGAIEQQAAAIASSHLIGPKGSGLTRGVTSSSITMGCVYTSADYAGYQQGIQAGFNAVNTSGGVNGRKLNLLRRARTTPRRPDQRAGGPAAGQPEQRVRRDLR